MIEPACRTALMPRVGGPALAPLRRHAAVRPAVRLPPVAGPADGESPCRTRGTGACATLPRGPSPQPGCRVRVVRGCRGTGGHAALSGRATAWRRGVRTACAALRRNGPDTGDLRGWARVPLAIGGHDAHETPRRRYATAWCLSGHASPDWDGSVTARRRSGRAATSAPSPARGAPVLAPPCCGLSRRCASTPSSTCSRARSSIPRR